MKLIKEDSGTYPATLAIADGDAVPEGFVEITDIVDAYKKGLAALSKKVPGWGDKLCFREKIKTMVYTKMQVAQPSDVDDQTKWDLLAAAEKKIAAELFLIGKESFFLEVENDLRVWTLRAGDYRCWTMQVREERAELAESILFMRLVNLGEAKQAMADLSQITLDTIIDIDDTTKKLKGKVRVKRMRDMYKEGLEDEAHDGVVAVVDWVKSEPGTPYQNKGFMNLGYSFQAGHTSESVRDELLSALNGTF